VSNDLVWFLTAYAVGTGFGWYLGMTKNIKDSAGLVIDSLIANGYLRHRTSKSGEIEILKLNEEE